MIDVDTTHMGDVSIRISRIVKNTPGKRNWSFFVHGFLNMAIYQLLSFLVISILPLCNDSNMATNLSYVPKFSLTLYTLNLHNLILIFGQYL
jgi:hypothetical protein